MSHSPESDKESDVESSSDVDLKQVKPKNKSILKSKLPSFETLKKIAMEHHISITDLFGNKLSTSLLYKKLKLLKLDTPIQKMKEKEKKQTDKMELYKEKMEEQFKKLSKKQKRTEKEETRFAQLNSIFKRIKDKEEDKVKLELRKKFIEEEKKRFDIVFNLSLLKGNELHDQLDEIETSDSDFDRQKFINVLQEVPQHKLLDILKKYVSHTDILSFYSTIVLYDLLGKDKQEEIQRFNELELSFMTSYEKERMEDLKRIGQKMGETKLDITYQLRLATLRHDKLQKEIDALLSLQKDDDDSSTTNIELKQKQDEQKEVDDRIKHLKQRLHPVSSITFIKQLLIELKSKLIVNHPVTPQNQKKIDRIDSQIKALFHDPFHPLTIHKKEVKCNVSNDELKTHLDQIVDKLTHMKQVVSQYEATKNGDVLLELHNVKLDLPKIDVYLHDPTFNALLQSIVSDQENLKRRSFIIFNELYDQIVALKTNPIMSPETDEQLHARNMIRLLEKQLNFLNQDEHINERKIKYIGEKPDVSERLHHLKQQLAVSTDQEEMERIQKRIAELEQFYKGSSYTIDQIVQTMTIQLLESSYDTPAEIEKINKLLAMYHIIDIDVYSKLKKEFMKENKRTFETDEYIKLRAKVEEEKVDKKDVDKLKVLQEKIEKEVEEHYVLLKKIEDKLKSLFDFKYLRDRLHTKKMNPKLSYHVPEHNCIPDWFKKPWVKSYKSFYVHSDDLPDWMVEKTDSVSFGKDTYHKGSRHLDILLCSIEKRHVDDFVHFSVDGKEYTIKLLYKQKNNHLVVNNEEVYQKELKWKNDLKITTSQRIEMYENRHVHELHQDLFIILRKKLELFFEKENALYLTNELLQQYQNRTVKDLLNKVGTYIIFLDKMYMKDIATEFNERLRKGIVSEKQLLELTIQDILYEVFAYNPLLLAKDELFKEIDTNLYELLKTIEDEEAVDYLKKHVNADLTHVIELYAKENDINVKDVKFYEKEHFYTLFQIEDPLFAHQEHSFKVYPKKVDIDIDEFIKKFPHVYLHYIKTYETKVNDMQKRLLEKAEEWIAYFTKTTVYNILLANRIVLQMDIKKPLALDTVFKSIDESNCTVKEPLAENDMIVYYVEDTDVYCFSLAKLVAKKPLSNPYTGKPFSMDFIRYVEKLSLPSIKTIEKLDVMEIPSVIDLVYNDIREREKDMKDQDYIKMFMEKRDALSVDLYPKEESSESEEESSEPVSPPKRKVNKKEESSESEEQSSESEEQSSESEEQSSESEEQSSESEEESSESEEQSSEPEESSEPVSPPKRKVNKK